MKKLYTWGILALLCVGAAPGYSVELSELKNKGQKIDLNLDLSSMQTRLDKVNDEVEAWNVMEGQKILEGLKTLHPETIQEIKNFLEQVDKRYTMNYGNQGEELTDPSIVADAIKNIVTSCEELVQLIGQSEKVDKDLDLLDNQIIQLMRTKKQLNQQADPIFQKMEKMMKSEYGQKSFWKSNDPFYL